MQKGKKVFDNQKGNLKFNSTIIAMAIAATLSLVAALFNAQSTVAFADVPFEIINHDGGMIIPAYGWDNQWDEIINAKVQNPEVEIIVIINPSGGPGDGEEGHWDEVITKLHDKDIKVIGYVSTSYGQRFIDEIKEDVTKYYQWYEIDGIFFDEQSASHGELEFYIEIYNFVKSTSSNGIVVTNPGAEAPEEYMDAADIMVIYESAGVPQDFKSEWMDKYNLNEFAVLPYGVQPDKTVTNKIQKEIGFVYIADDASWMSLADSFLDQAEWIGRY